MTPFELPDGIDIEWIGNRMAVNAWYPAVYYGLSLGSQDTLGRALLEPRDSLTDEGVRFNTAPEDALRMPEARNTSDRFRVFRRHRGSLRVIRKESRRGSVCPGSFLAPGVCCPRQDLEPGARRSRTKCTSPDS